MLVITKIQKRVMIAAFVITNLFIATLTAHATYNYLDNTDKLNHVQTNNK